jgi:hypothetical protein
MVWERLTRHQDEPPARPNSVEYDWMAELHKLMKMKKILGSHNSIDEKVSMSSKLKLNHHFHLYFIADSTSDTAPRVHLRERDGISQNCVTTTHRTITEREIIDQAL